MAKNNMIIILGNTRIRVNNIKNYGISSKIRPYEKIYGVEKMVFVQKRKGLGKIFGEEKRIEKNVLVWKGRLVAINDERLFRIDLEDSYYYDPITDKQINRARKRYQNEKGELAEGFEWATRENSVVDKRVKYLYITTYQNDNFIFWEDEVNFDISEKCDELDKIFGGKN